MVRNSGASKRLFLRTLAALCLFAMLLCVYCQAAYAASGVDTDADCRLTLTCKYNEMTLAGMTFRLYRVANISPAGTFTLSGDFKDYSVKINGLSNAEWKAAANTLAVYVKPDGIAAVKTAVSDSAGRIDFGTLPTGLYLLVCDGVQIGGTVYNAAPSLVSLPYRQNSSAWIYDVDVIPKTVIVPQHSDKVDITVIKVWDDSKNKNIRPDSIRVVLLRDGAAYETVTLEADNAWRHTWRGLNGDSGWTVMEVRVPTGYDVTYTSGENALIITNSLSTIDVDGPTLSTDNNKETTTKGGSVTTTDTSGITPGGGTSIPGTTTQAGGNGSGGNGDNDSTGDSGDGDDVKLPQTGLLWWPVPLLAVAGLFLFGFGWMIKYGLKEKDNEE